MATGTGKKEREILMLSFLSAALIPILVCFFLLYGTYKRVPVYETFTEGAKEGFYISVRIIPYLVAMMVAVGMFRASGAIDLLAEALKPFLVWAGIPADLLPLAITRSLSGSGARGIFAELAAAHGPDSPVTKTAAVMLGSSETTFYVLSVYFGAVGVTKFRHAVSAGIVADLAGVVIALIVSKLAFY